MTDPSGFQNEGPTGGAMMGPTGPTGGGGAEQTFPVVTWSSGGSPTIDMPEMVIVGSASAASRAADAGRASNGGGTTSVPATGSNGEVQQHSTGPLNGGNQGQSQAIAGLAVDGAAQTGADAGVSSSPANQATSAPSADEGGIIAGGPAMNVQPGQSQSPQSAGGASSMAGYVRSSLEAAAWVPGAVGSLASAALVGIDVYQGNYGQAAMGALGIFGGRAATSGVRAMRDTKIVTAALEGISGLGPKISGAFARWAGGATRGGGRVGSSFGTSTVGAAQRILGRVVQTGGNKINKSTAEALNKTTGSTLAPREWGRGLEALKRDYGLPNNHHGKLTEYGFYLDEAGEALGNILDYL